MVKTILSLCATFVAVVSLTGCAAFPGQRMSGSGDGSETVRGMGEVRMVPITSELVAAPREQATVPQELSAYQPESYGIRPGDTILVTVWDHPELSTPAGTQQQAIANGRQVQPDGTFFFPYAGKMNVAGMTPQELRTKLAQALGRFLAEPQVDVNVVGFGGRIVMQGAFEDTTPQEFTTLPLTLSQAVGRARVNSEEADLSGLVLVRDGRSYRMDLDALNRNPEVAQDVYLKPGDRIFLPYNDRKEVYVLGEVIRPQAIPYKTSDISLTQALGRTGGLNPISSKGGAVYVIRGAEKLQAAEATVYHLDATSPAAFALGDKFPLQAGDVVWVGPAGVTRWNRFLSQILPISGLISNAAAAQYNLDRVGN